MSDVFKTNQTVRRYDDAIIRHAQWIRWVRAITCPCVNPNTMQPDIRCTMCKGRGYIYRNPGTFSIKQEVAKHNGFGVITPRYGPVSNPVVWRRGEKLPLADPQPDPNVITLEGPNYPRLYQRMYIDYDFRPVQSIIAEEAEVIDTNILRVVGARFEDQGKQFEGSIETVTRVENVTKSETYTVSEAIKEYIFLDGMGTYADGDVIEVDYTYIRPFQFVLHTVTPAMRYEPSYVSQDTAATLLVPSWANPAPNDLFTAMAQESPASAVIDPTFTPGDDVIRDYFDLSTIEFVMDKNGTEYTPGEDVVLIGRNKVHWLVTKPTVAYTIEFTHHPTFSSVREPQTIRTAENKEFANKVSLKQYQITNTVQSF